MSTIAMTLRMSVTFLTSAVAVMSLMIVIAVMTAMFIRQCMTFLKSWMSLSTCVPMMSWCPGWMHVMFVMSLIIVISVISLSTVVFEWCLWNSLLLWRHPLYPWLTPNICGVPDVLYEFEFHDVRDGLGDSDIRNVGNVYDFLDWLAVHYVY